MLKRDWLNPDGGPAAYEWATDGVNNVFEIRDSLRAVSLDFSIHSPGDWFVALTKIVRLRRALQEFEQALVAGYRARVAAEGESRSEIGGADAAS